MSEQDMMNEQPRRDTLHGVGVSPGRVIAPLVHMAPAVSEPPEDEALEGDAETATDRLKAAALAVKAGLKERAARARSESAAEAGAEGVGLLRTEFCFLGRDSEPTVEEQADAYTEVFEAFPGRKVVVRTLDAGADKPLPFLTDATEPNPALGVRGYRTDWTTPGVLERQLEAIAVAKQRSTADVWVMAPMIATVGEAARFHDLVVAAGLKVSGVMVETPAAAITAEQILERVDFVSLGTNDLTQYTMAADRMLGSLADLNSPWQPAVLRMIQATARGAAQASERGGEHKNVGVCGEAAADPALAVVLVGLGVDTLSMSPRSLAAVSAVLARVDAAEARRLAELALHATSAQEAKEAVRAELPVLADLGL